MQENKTTMAELLELLPSMEPIVKVKTIAEQLRENKQAIIGLLKMGYTHKSIAEYLTKNGLSVSEYQVKNCVTAAKRTRKPKQAAAQTGEKLGDTYA